MQKLIQFASFVSIRTISCAQSPTSSVDQSPNFPASSKSPANSHQIYQLAFTPLSQSVWHGRCRYALRAKAMRRFIRIHLRVVFSPRNYLKLLRLRTTGGAA
jgi:hypothetical protein